MFGHRIVILCLLFSLVTVGAPLAGMEGPDSTVVADTATATTDIGGIVENAADENMAVPSVTDMLVPSLTRIGLSLLVIVAFIYGMVLLLRKLSGNKLGGSSRNKTVHLIEQTYLAPKKSVCLLKLADRAVLVGVTETQISMLTEMEWESMPQDALSKVMGKEAGFQGFLNDAVGKMFGGKKNKGAHGEQAV